MLARQIISQLRRSCPTSSIAKPSEYWCRREMSAVTGAEKVPAKRPAQGKPGGKKPRKPKRSKRDKNIRALGTSDDILRADILALLRAKPAENGDVASGQNEGGQETQSTEPAQWSEHEVTIEALSSGGEGLGRTSSDSHRVFKVPFTVPGDVALAKVVANLEEPIVHTRADLVKIVKRSAERDDSLVRCRYFGECGGCSLQMLPYAYQLDFKKSIVERAFRNFSGLPAEVVPAVNSVIGSPRQYGYRTKLTPHFNAPGPMSRAQRRNGERPVYSQVPAIGFDRKQMRRTMDIEECPLATKACQEGLTQERQRVAKQLDKYPRGATLNIREHTERYAAGLREAADSQDIVHEDKQGDYVYAKSFVTSPKAVFSEWIDGYRIQNVANSFFQNNNSILSAFIGYLRAQVQPSAAASTESVATSQPNQALTNLIDAYCGCGVFSIMLSARFQHTLGVDIDPAAIEQAKANADANLAATNTPTAGAARPEFFATDASNMFASMKSFDPSKTVVIIDPPRKGCDESFLQQLLDFAPQRIVYVSCNVHTQASDVGWLLSGGGGGAVSRTSEVTSPDTPQTDIVTSAAKYTIESIQPMDFFPQTHHVESVAVLQRKPDSSSPA